MDDENKLDSDGSRERNCEASGMASSISISTPDMTDKSLRPHSNDMIFGSPWKISASFNPLPSFSDLLKSETNGPCEYSPIQLFSPQNTTFQRRDDIEYQNDQNDDDTTKIPGFYYDRKPNVNEYSPYNSQCSTPMHSNSTDSTSTVQKSASCDISSLNIQSIMIGPDDQSSSSLKKHYSGWSSSFSRPIPLIYDQDQAGTTRSSIWRPTPQWKQKRLKKIRFVYSNFRLIISSNSPVIQKYSPNISSILYQSTIPVSLDVDPKHSDFPLFLKHPDVFPLWSDIVAVIQYQTFFSKEREQHDMGRTIPTISWPCCSICLAEWTNASKSHINLVCPRLTPCGHTFCYPCLVHYFIEREAKWRPCPVCFEYFCLEEVKPLIIHSLLKESTKQEYFQFSKMTQLPETILTESATDNFCKSVCIPIVSSFGLSYWLEKDPFNKYFIASPEWCLETIYNSELSKLIEMLHQSVQEEEWTMTPFYEISISNIEKWISNSLGSKDKIKSASNSIPTSIQDLYTICKPEEDTGEQKESEMFYQSSDGRFLFLAPSSIRKLEEKMYTLPLEFSYELDGLDTVGEFEELVMTRERRMRYSKYFGHLPLGCRFILLYIQ